MTAGQRLLAVLALVIMVALTSACGSSAPTETSSSAGSAQPAAAAGGSGGSRAAAKNEKGVKFAECMRSHGVGNFPDPGASGSFTIDEVANGSSVDTNAPAFTRAISACKSLEPAGFTGGERTARQQAGAIRFAQCIRENGVKDFPDPVNGQPLVDTNKIPSTNSPGGMSALNAAMQKCGSMGAAAGVHR